MAISWYSLKEHKQEDFSSVFELVESKYVEITATIVSNNDDFEHKELQQHFKENCLNNFDYISFNDSPLFDGISCYLKIFCNKIQIRDNNVSNYDFKKLCDIIRTDRAFEHDLNKTMTEFNDKQSLLEPTTHLVEDWHIGSWSRRFKPWYKSYVEITRGYKDEVKTEEDKVIIKIFVNLIVKTDFAYLFDNFKPKNLIYMSTTDESDINLNNFKHLQDYMYTRKIVRQLRKRDIEILYLIPLHNNAEFFINLIHFNHPERIKINLLNFIVNIQQNKHCFEENKIISSNFKNVETQTALSLRHFE